MHQHKRFLHYSIGSNYTHLVCFCMLFVGVKVFCFPYSNDKMFCMQFFVYVRLCGKYKMFMMFAIVLVESSFIHDVAELSLFCFQSK